MNFGRHWIVSEVNHKRFLKHLDQSQDAVWTVAQWLHGKGHRVSIPPTTKAENHSEWKDHADGGDLYISQRVEVKQRFVDFTSADDWPYESFIVCARHSWDRAVPKPFSYVYLNKDMTYAGVVLGSSASEWWVESIKDSRYEDEVQECYVASLTTVNFFKLNK
jgi:hypothetical protein